MERAVHYYRPTSSQGSKLCPIKKTTHYGSKTRQLPRLLPKGGRHGKHLSHSQYVLGADYQGGQRVSPAWLPLHHPVRRHVLHCLPLCHHFPLPARALFQKKLTNPTLDDFLNIESEAPNCPCARPLNQVKSVPTFVSTQTTAVCDPTKQGTCSIIQDAFLNSNDAALSAALNATTGPDAEERQSLAVWTEDVLGSADGYCFTISNAIERIESTLGATAIGGGSLLPRSDFEDSMLAAIRSAFLSIANEYTNAGTVRVAAEAALHHNDPFRNAPHRHRPQTLRKNAAAGRIQQFAGSRDMAGLEAAKDRSPRGCRCSGSDAKPFCRFNLEIGGIEHEGGCSVSALVRGINAKALDTTLYTKSFGIFPPNTPKASSSDYTVFDGPFHEYIDVCDEAFFSLYDKEDLALPEVAFSEYFDQCAPTECSYVEIRRPSVTELIALMLGLLGGLTTVIRVGVGVVGKKLFRGKTSVESSTKPHGTRDGMSGVEMSRPENA